jgi:hypothetical protein
MKPTNVVSVLGVSNLIASSTSSQTAPGPLQLAGFFQDYLMLQYYYWYLDYIEQYPLI